MGYFAIPLASPFGRILVGTADFPHDAVLNTGILEWGRQTLFSGRVFDWNGGYPLPNMLAATENLIGWQPFYMPLRALGVGVVAAYNILLIGSFVVSALGVALLARRLGAERWGACAAGIIFAYAPFHLSHTMHLQTMAVCWSPFAVLALDRALERPRLGDCVWLIVFVTLSMLSGMYVGIFLSAVLLLYAILSWIVGRARLRWNVVRALASAGMVTLVGLFPVLRHYARFNAQHGLHHSTDVLVRFSLDLLALARVPVWLAAWSGSWLPRDAIGAGAFPGLVATTLVICLFVLRRRTIDRGVAIVVTSIAVVAFVFALGPVLKVHSGYPAAISPWVPLPGRIFTVVSAIRWPVRSFMYSLLFGSLLAGFGLSTALSKCGRRARGVLGATVLLLLVFEYRPGASYSTRAITLPPPLLMSSAYPYLATEHDSGGIVELPLADTTGYRTPMRARYVYGSAGHMRRVVAMHGTTHPALPDSLEASAAQLPSVGARRMLTDHGVTRLVIHCDLMPRAVGNRLIDSLRRSGYVFLHDADDAAVVALPPESEVSKPRHECTELRGPDVPAARTRQAPARVCGFASYELRLAYRRLAHRHDSGRTARASSVDVDASQRGEAKRRSRYRRVRSSSWRPGESARDGRGQTQPLAWRSPRLSH